MTSFKGKVMNKQLSTTLFFVFLVITLPLSGCIGTLETHYAKKYGLIKESGSEIAANAEFIAQGELRPQWQKGTTSFDVDETAAVSDKFTLVGFVELDARYGSPSYGPYKLYENETGKIVWEFKRPADPKLRYSIVATSPSIVISQYHITDDEQIYYLLNPENGKTITNIKVNIVHAVALSHDNSKIFFVVKDNKKTTVMAIDLKSGKEIFKTSANKEFNDGTTARYINNALIVFGSDIFSLNTQTGQELWNLKLNKDKANLLNPYIGRDAYIIPFSDGTLFKVSKEGKIIWQDNIAGYAAAITQLDNTIVIQQRNNETHDTLIAINYNNGKKLWENNLQGLIRSSLLKIKNRFVYTIQTTDDKSSFEVRDFSTGKLQYLDTLPYGKSRRLPDQLFTYDGNTFVVVQETGVYAYDSHSREKKWGHDIKSFRTSYFYSKNTLSIFEGDFEKLNPENIRKERRKKEWHLDVADTFDKLYFEQGEAADRSNRPGTAPAGWNHKEKTRRSMAALGRAIEGLGNSMVEGMKLAPIRAKSFRYPLALFLSEKTHQASVQGDYFIRAYVDESKHIGHWGFIVVDMRNGRWMDIATSPHVESYIDAFDFESLMLQLPRLSKDGKYVVLKGLGLDQSAWKEVQLGTAHKGVYPSILGYKIDLNQLKPANAISSNGGYGYIKKDGTMTIHPQFEKAMPFKEGLAAVMVNGKWGFINKNGKFVIDPHYEKVGNFSDGLTEVKQNEKSSYINNEGKIVISGNFIDAGSFHEGYAPVSLPNNQVAIINKKGSLVATYDNKKCISELREGFIYISNQKSNKSEICSKAWHLDDPYIYVSKNGNWEEEKEEYKYAYPSREGLRFINGAFVDTNGNRIVPKEGLADDSMNYVNDSNGFSEGLYRVKDGTTRKPIGYIDKTGNMSLRLKTKLDCVTNFTDGMARACLDCGFYCFVDRGSWGYIDKTGQMVINPEYVNIKDFSEGLAAVQFKSDGRYSFIDKKGREAIQTRFRNAESFSEGFAAVLVSGKTWYLDGAPM
jgi:outer membrane protein assembly factor BamB